VKTKALQTIDLITHNPEKSLRVCTHIVLASFLGG